MQSYSHSKMQVADDAVIFRKNPNALLLNTPQWQPPPKCSSPKNWHPANLGLTIGVMLFLISGVIDFLGWNDEKKELVWNRMAASNTVVWIGVALMYVFYIIEAFFICTIPRTLWKIRTLPSCAEMIQTVRQNPPSLHFRVNNFHYESREVTLKNKDGSDFTDQVRTRVNTYSETDTFRYREWYDESDRLIELNEYAIVRLKLKKSIHACDVETEQAIRMQRASLEDKNRHRDDYQDSDMWVMVPGFSEEYTCVATNNSPAWVSVLLYILCSIFLFSWPFRILFEANLGELTFCCRKFVTIKDGNGGLKVRASDD